MRHDAAVRLARRMEDAWPSQVTDGWIGLVCERLASMDEGPAARGIEQLIDSSRFLPSVADLRDAYAGCGGTVVDPGRNMSPPVKRFPSSAAEPAEVVALLQSRRGRMHDEQRGPSVLPEPSSNAHGASGAPAVS